MKLAIIGVGLIGGSLALKSKRLNLFSEIIGIDANPNHLRQAISLGIIDRQADLKEGIQQADAVMIAVPVEATISLLPQVLDYVEAQCVFDVASTKESIIRSVENHPKRQNYVATHPMWGTENSGPQAATENAFEGRSLVLCDTENSAPDKVDFIKNLYQALGMHLIYMNAKEHDVHTAYVSHISHVTSYALANTVLEKEKQEETIFQLASSGFSSTVRLAKSHAAMWLPIFKHNRENLLDVLDEHISQLEQFRKDLILENYDKVEDFILNANRIRGVLEEKKPKN
ncbi:prephenate dehydrogenase [Ornithobacterium rhinotracheale]|uniref:prephenate dehydrogenase n=1 Tax=Ornithobacterium rhinotracheale TaxID=28251 RepID=UPI00129CE4B8|nr:prephenate dehydrogenase [Ornithobacterium rhinotracheale]MRJ07358.1 prephenate dehydrogenase [Ornithobacterium rhinotracheale]UOH77957.1 prephenate dehydrogenase [Ornithobacterium rhinotracheale]